MRRVGSICSQVGGGGGRPHPRALWVSLGDPGALAAGPMHITRRRCTLPDWVGPHPPHPTDPTRSELTRLWVTQPFIYV